MKSSTLLKLEFNRGKLIELMGIPLEEKELEVKVLDEKDMGGFLFKKISYRSLEDYVRAYVIVPKDSCGAGVVCLHQHGGLFKIGKNQVVGIEGSKDQKYGLELAERGYVVIAPDAKYFGERLEKNVSGWRGRSEGEESERFGAMKELLYGRTLQGLMVWDAMRAVDYLVEYENVDEKRIGAIGHSMGGQWTLYLAAVDTRIAAAVSNCGFASHRSFLEHKIIHNFAAYIPGMLKYMDVPDVLCLVAPRAFMIIAGKRDPVFPLEGVVEVYEKAREIYSEMNAEVKLKLSVFDTGHEFNKDMRNRAYMWLDKWLK
ncbi:MAG: hypothetical protein DRJ63_06290 [Thermoprotei archaeon]|nr:MAG: hypothetical protein DRJ63_06290 [Thermoprotei archaeon]